MCYEARSAMKHAVLGSTPPTLKF